MGRLRKILWISGGLILGICTITMLSQVYWEGLGWDGINLNTYLFWYIFGGILILIMIVYDIVSFFLLRSNVHHLMDEYEQITPEEIAKILNEPLWRVRPIFRKREDPGILIIQSGKYTHFNETFEEEFLEQYSQGLSIGELAHHFNLSKNEIILILDELEYKEILPEVTTPAEGPEHEEITKGLRKTVRLRKKYKKQRRK